ncbi:bifunctional glycosyltransferase/CDP-glycerol:glycerophosphate glycerophosphotransferase [Leuconostoc mesenteroides]|uniref:bifunctional glycosyltransferase/CDP-glycerol:glycerophosphate glycerophosphotransferase n=1 Tax=Leuconostoc mesenteroides TaxID=1245 RepID=UPI00235E854F|nr:CDP-glycerol glycerophosphotransferase family protein [Leuconostoc mesenteroides]
MSKKNRHRIVNTTLTQDESGKNKLQPDTRSTQHSDKLFSIIIAAYNVEAYLDDALESILNQNLNFERYIEIIIINDGSQDSTLLIANDWSARYPNNIKVIDQNNCGVSAARNTGLRVANGRYVNFMDGDDKLENNVLLEIKMFFERNANIKIAKIPLKLFEAKTGPHGLNKVFTKPEEVVNIEKSPNKIFAHISSTFILRDVLVSNRLNFEVGRKYGEDLALVAKLVETEKQFGLINNVYYLYRARDAADSAMDSSRSDPETYIPNAEMMMQLIYQHLNADKRIDKWLQMLIMYDLAWKIKRNELPFEADKQWYEKYLEKVTDILQFIDDDVVDSQGHIKWVEKEAIKSIKYSGRWPNYKKNIGNTIIRNNDVEIRIGSKKYELSNLHAKIYVAKYRSELDVLTLVVTIDHLWGEQLDLIATDGLHNFSSVKIQESVRQKMIGIPLHAMLTYEFDIPLNDLETSKNLFFYANFDEVKRRIRTEFAGMLVTIGGGIKKNYIWSPTKLIKFDFNKNEFVIFDNTIKKLQDLENDFKKSILVTKLLPKRKDELIFLRKLALESKASNEVINIFQDRENKADDNAEVFYQTVEAAHPEWQNYFILERDSVDWNRLESLNYKLIEYGSKEHERLLVQATNLISSQADLTIMRPWPKDFGYLRDSYHYNFIFLQHGVTKHDLSLWLRKIEKDIRVLVTVSDYEKKGFLNYGYEYKNSEVVVTGFPRFDRFGLNNEIEFKKSGVILIAPTWRNGIWTDKDTIEIKEQKLRGTDFFVKWQELLMSNKIKELANSGNKILWLPHPHFREVERAFELPDYIKEVEFQERYVDILKYSDVLITDFSSIYFDMAYQNKPTLYYQFDAGNVNNKEGYFNFETMGFGSVSETLEGLQRELHEIIKSGFIIDEKYRERIVDFFKYTDSNSSNRLLSVIEEISVFKQAPKKLSREDLDYIFNKNNSKIELGAEKTKTSISNMNVKKLAKKVLKKNSKAYKFAGYIYKKMK